MPGSDGDDRRADAAGAEGMQCRLRKLEASVLLLNRCFKTGSPLLGSLRVLESKPDGSPTSGRVSALGLDSASAAGDQEELSEVGTWTSTTRADSGLGVTADVREMLAELEAKLRCRMGVLEASVQGRIAVVEEQVGSLGERLSGVEEARRAQAARVDEHAAGMLQPEGEPSVALTRISEWVERLDKDIREAVTRLSEWVAKLDTDLNGLQRQCGQAQSGSEEVSKLSEQMAKLEESMSGLQRSCKAEPVLARDDAAGARLRDRVAELEDRLSSLQTGRSEAGTVLQHTEQLARLEVEVTSFRVLSESAGVAAQDAALALRRDVGKLQEDRVVEQQHLDVLQAQADALQARLQREASGAATLADGLGRAAEERASMLQSLDKIWGGLGAERQERQKSLHALAESLEAGLQRLVQKVDATCVDLARREAEDVRSLSLTRSEHLVSKDRSRSPAAVPLDTARLKEAKDMVAGDLLAAELASIHTAAVLNMVGKSTEADSGRGSTAVSRAESAPPQRSSCQCGALPAPSPAPPTPSATIVVAAPVQEPPAQSAVPGDHSAQPPQGSGSLRFQGRARGPVQRPLMPVLLGGAPAQIKRLSSEPVFRDGQPCQDCAEASGCGSPPRYPPPRSPHQATRQLLAPQAHRPGATPGRGLTRTDSNPAHVHFTPKLAAVVEGPSRTRGPVHWSTPTSPVPGTRKL